MTLRVDNTLPSVAAIDKLPAISPARPDTPPIVEHHSVILPTELPSSGYRSSEPERSSAGAIPEGRDQEMEPEVTSATRSYQERPAGLPRKPTTAGTSDIAEALQSQPAWMPLGLPAILPSFPPTLPTREAIPLVHLPIAPVSPSAAGLTPSGHVNADSSPVLDASSPIAPIPPNEPPTADNAQETVPDDCMAPTRIELEDEPSLHDQVPSTIPLEPRDTEALPDGGPVSQSSQQKRRGNPDGVFARGQIVPCSFHVLGEDKHDMVVLLIEVGTTAGKRERQLIYSNLAVAASFH